MTPGHMRPPPYLAAPGPPASPPYQRPAEALRALAAQLTRVGTTRLYGNACTHYGVLSISYGLTVWTNGRVLWWRHNGRETTWPAADPQGAARLLTTLTPGPRRTQPPNDP
jgi:hypothetical protein